MRSRSRIPSDSFDRSDINISPMIDLVFILLIFFIVTTVFIDEEGLALNRPEPVATETLEEEDVIRIRVTEKGRLFHQKKEIPLGDVRLLVRNKNTPLLIEVEDKARSGLMVSVMDEAKAAGARTISLHPAPN